MYVDNNTDTYKLFKLEQFLNKRMVKRDRGYSLKYLVRWKRCSLNWDRWYNVKELDNAVALVNNYEASLAATRTHADGEFSLSKPHSPHAPSY